MDSLSDDALLARARVFDRAALTAVYDRYNERIYYFALRMLGDPQLAEECTAETFQRLLNALHRGGGPQNNLKAYLFRTAHNWVTDVYRRTPPLPLEDTLEYLAETDHPAGAQQAGSNPEQEAEKRIQQAQMRAALRLLTAEQRQVILLRYIEGWTLEEIAISLEKTTGAIKALQHRAVAALQKILVSERGTSDEP